MPDPRYCCVLGLCCPPGSAAQRADLKAWLLKKMCLPSFARAIESSANLEAEIDSWLDELPWEQAGE